MEKKEIIEELKDILKVYHYDNQAQQYIPQDVVTSLENLLGSLLREQPKQLEFPFPELEAHV